MRAGASDMARTSTGSGTPLSSAQVNIDGQWIGAPGMPNGAAKMSSRPAVLGGKL